MFGLIENLAKAAVSVAATPVALAVDVLSLPSTAMDNKGPFDRTQALLNNAGHCVSEAIKPARD